MMNEWKTRLERLLQSTWSIWVLLAILLAEKLFSLVQFGFKYTDSDQSIMWLATTHFAEGLFYEPRFYGQDYNTTLEAFLATPLYWLNIPLNIALPLTTVFLAILPFLVAVYVAVKNNARQQALLILAIAIALPVEYDLITSLSRGFVTGIAVTSLGLLSLLNQGGKWKWVLLGFTSVLGFSINPNAVLITIPLAFYHLLHNYSNKQFYVLVTMGALPAIALHIAAHWFYIEHPEYVLHSYWIEFSWENFSNAIQTLDDFFNAVTPFFWKQGWISLLIPIGLAVLAYYQKNKQLSLVFISIPFLFLLPLFSSKIQDGSLSIFFPHARMYLAIPVTLSFMIMLTRWKYSVATGLILAITIVLAVVKPLQLSEVIQKHTSMQSHVSILKTDELNKLCEQLGEAASSHDVGLIIIHNHWYYDFYTYACPCLVDNLPPTIRPSYERRTWRLKEVEKETYPSILMIDQTLHLSELDSSFVLLNEYHGFYLIQDNNQPTQQLLNSLNIPLRDI